MVVLNSGTPSITFNTEVLVPDTGAGVDTRNLRRYVREYASTVCSAFTVDPTASAFVSRCGGRAGCSLSIVETAYNASFPDRRRTVGPLRLSVLNDTFVIGNESVVAVNGDSVTTTLIATPGNGCYINDSDNGAQTDTGPLLLFGSCNATANHNCLYIIGD
jgi:hypothetical protein